LGEGHDDNIIQRIRGSSIPFVALLCLFLLLGLWVLYPLSSALSWAAVLSFFMYPVYRFIYRRVFRGRFPYLAAAINTALILFLLVLPMIGAGIAITRELGRLYQFFVEWFPGNREVPLREILALPQLDWIFSRVPDFVNLPVWNDLVSNVSGILATLMTRLSRELLGNAFKIAYTLLVITVGSFFLTVDGHRILQFIRDILPLSCEAKDAFFLRSRQMLYAIFYGIIMTAGIQGTLGGLGWWFVGLGNPVLFGALMFFFAMLPFVGTPIIWVPGVIYLFVHGNMREGVMLLLWGLAVVSSIDNILRPLFISEGSKAHILLIFAGVLGGISAWGFLGLFLGPLVLSVTYFLLQLYRLIVMVPECGTAFGTAERSPAAGGDEKTCG
jgi:Predicted permease